MGLGCPAGEKCVLGLATGSSPTQVYKYLVRWHREGALSFKNVITFNLVGLNVWTSQHAFHAVHQLVSSICLSLALSHTLRLLLVNMWRQELHAVPCIAGRVLWHAAGRSAELPPFHERPPLRPPQRHRARQHPHPGWHYHLCSGHPQVSQHAQVSCHPQLQSSVSSTMLPCST